ncbi:MAG: hypothetical protein IJ324_10010 [Lachnospiraceae bacterium]|nr:hypothetical protein [Lachnospiraceae bacterium]
MKKKSLILIIIGIVALLIAVVESCWYYVPYMANEFLYVEMIIQNIIKFCLLSPEISIEDATKVLGANSSAMQVIVANAYGVAVLAIQFAAIVTLFQMILIGVRKSFSSLFTRKDEHIFVFGYNEKVQILLENKKNESKRRAIHLVTDASISRKQMFSWLGEGIFLHRGDVLTADEEQAVKWAKKVGIERAAGIVLFEEDAFKNVKWFYTLKKMPALPKETKFHVYSTNKDVDSLFVEAEKNVESLSGADYFFFDLYEMRVRKLLSDDKTVLHSYNRSLPEGSFRKYDVHVLLVGFGKLGEKFLTQALNMAVLSPDSRIVFDIVGKNIAESKLYFESCFSEKYVERDADSIAIKGNAADGELLLRFYETDVCGIEYRCIVNRLMKEMPFTYAAVCIERAELAMRCALETKRCLLNGQGEKAQNVPVATRMEINSPIIEALGMSNAYYSNIVPICSEREVLRLDVICDTELEKRCREFNHMYDSIVESVPWDKNDYIEKALKARIKTDVADNWDKLVYYKKESNRRLYAHRVVRDWLSEGHDVRGEREFLVSMAKTEHRRWNYYMALEGWAYINGKKVEQKKLTPYLCDWETLEMDNAEVCAYDLLALLVEHGAEEDECAEAEKEVFP